VEERWVRGILPGHIDKLHTIEDLSKLFILKKIYLLARSFWKYVILCNVCV